MRPSPPSLVTALTDYLAFGEWVTWRRLTTFRCCLSQRFCIATPNTPTRMSFADVHDTEEAEGVELSENVAEDYVKKK
jgi:hypothetical protein